MIFEYFPDIVRGCAEIVHGDFSEIFWRIPKTVPTYS